MTTPSALPRLIPLLTVAALGLALTRPAAAAPGKSPARAPADPCAVRPVGGEPSLAQVEADFGCADAANLRAMLADPRDLARGRAFVEVAGDPALAAARRWREGQPKPLPDSGGATAAPAGAPAQGGR